ncbi:MAG: hypothetical protein H7A46_09960 [Verrucomicrobiales bacterium]|nr:hypothetical protein [Verrucomicrobiales bacterium]
MDDDMVLPAGNSAPESTADVARSSPDALAAELNSQREMSKRLIEQSNKLLQSVGSFNDQAKSLRQVLEANDAMRSQWPALTNRVQQLERQLEEGHNCPDISPTASTG